MLLSFWCCQIQLLQMYWLLTLIYSCFIQVCPFVRMLCDIETSCATNDMEMGGIYCPSNQNHEAPYENLTSSGAQLSHKDNHQPRGFLWFVTCTVQLWQCLEIHAAGNSFFLHQNVYTHTSASIKIIPKKEQIHIRFRKQTVPYSVFIVLLLHIKNSVTHLLAKFQPNYL